MNINKLVYYETYHYRGKDKPRTVSLSHGKIIGENLLKYKLRNIYNGREVWRMKDNVRFD